MTTISGRYEIDSEIGRGGMGVVYLAVDSTIGRKVALKKLAIDSSDPESGDAVKRFMREARLTGQLHHADIVTLFDVVDENGDLYLVLEYYPSRSLADVVDDDGPLSEERVREIGASIAGALSAAHAEGVVHRDIKPENILVGEKGAKLTDFGIARISEAGHDPGSRITKTGFYVGTLGYMAPEQIAEHEASPASDVFAAGGVLYFCLTGEDPFGDGPLPAVLYRIVNDDPDIERLNASEDLKAIIRAAMAKDPSARPQCEGLKAALAGSAADLGLGPPPDSQAGYVAPGFSLGQIPDQYSPGQIPEQYSPGQIPEQYSPSQYAVPEQYSSGQIPEQYSASSQAPAAPPKRKKSKAGKVVLIVVLLLLLLVALAAVRTGIKNANNQGGKAVAPGKGTPYSSSQGFKVSVPPQWNSDFEATRGVDRFWPKVGQGGVMIHKYDQVRPDLVGLDDGTIMSMVRVDPIGQTQLKLDPKSVNIDRTSSYSGHAAVSVTYELDTQGGQAQYAAKAYFFNAGNATWSVYEIATKSERQNMQARFSEIQESFLVSEPVPAGK